MELSKYQERILEYFMSNPTGNMLIEALAGTGKTSTILELTKHTTTSDVYVAFNKSIQEEMTGKLVNPKTKCYTMHSWGYSVMRYNLELLHITPEVDAYKSNKIFSDLYDKEYEPLKRTNYKKFNEYKKFLEKHYVSLYHSVRLKCIDCNNNSDGVLDNNANRIKAVIDELGLFQTDGQYVAPEIEEILYFLRYIDAANNKVFEEQHICDFTDMLFITYNKLRSGLWKIPYWLYFTNIFADEVQDFSPIQFKLIKFFKRKNGRFVFVGDKNQAIYGFSGADIYAWNSIPQMFEPVKVFELPINYRCGKQILANVRKDFNIPILPADNASEGSVQKIDNEKMYSLVNNNDFILSRYNVDLIKCAVQLLKLKKKFYIHDTILIEAVISFIKDKAKSDLHTFALYVDRILKDAAKNDENIKKIDPEVLTQLEISNVLIKTYSEEYHDSNDVQKFIQWIEANFSNLNNSNCIKLMSIHKSKGLESANVFVLHEALPQTQLARSDGMRTQEINLSYVAQTRAKDLLYLVGD